MRTGMMIAAVGIVLGAAGVVTLLDHDEGTAGSVRQAQGMPANPGQAPQARQLPVLPPAAATPTPGPAATPSLAVRVKALADSKNPADAYKAFLLLEKCRSFVVWRRDSELTRQAERDERFAEAQRSGTLDAQLEKQCGGLTPDSFTQIVPLLERASAMGVLHAASALTREGPFGKGWVDVDMRPDDPLVIAWKQRMGEVLKAAATKGDYIASMQLAENFGSGAGILDQHSAYQELKYTVASKTAHNLAQPDTPVDKSGRLVDLLSRKLPPEQAKAAIAEGVQLAAAGAQK